MRRQVVRGFEPTAFTDGKSTNNHPFSYQVADKIDSLLGTGYRGESKIKCAERFLEQRRHNDGIPALRSRTVTETK